MEDELRKLPLRSVADEYADRVMRHIERETVYARRTNALIGVQILVSGVIAVLVAVALGEGMTPLWYEMSEFSDSVQLIYEQFMRDVMAAIANAQFEPLLNLAPHEWITLSITAGVAWLLANGLLIIEFRKGKLA